MRRLSLLALIAVLAAAAATTVAEGASGPVTLHVWLPFTARELGVMKHAIGEYDAKHPELKIAVGPHCDVLYPTAPTL